MTKLFRSRLWVLPIVGVLAGAAGCAADSGPPEPAEGAVQSALSEDERPHAKRPHGPGGPEFLLFAAQHELELSDAQKATIDRAIEDLHAARGKRGQPDNAPFAALAAGVRAGKVDVGAVLAKASPSEPAFEQHRAASAAALQKLHATLTAEQRRELVDAVSAKMSEHGPKGEGRGPKGEGRAAKRGDGPKGERGDHDRGARGPLGHLLQDLELTDAQRQSVEQAMQAQKPSEADREAKAKRFEEMRAGMRSKLESFAADAFDAKAFTTPADGPSAHGPKQRLEHLANVLAAVAPILDPAQREKLATRLEQGPPDRSMRRGGPRGKGAPPSRGR
jgi:Spy/CpxP family protein refolding chaperone